MNKNIKKVLFSWVLVLILIIQHIPFAISQEFNQEDLDQIKLKLDSGRHYYFIGDYESSLEKYYRASEIAEKINYKEDLAKCYNNIGAVYINLFEFDLALKYLHQSLSIKQELNDSSGIASTLANISGIYQERKEEDKALQTYNEALEIVIHLKDTSVMSTIYNNIGTIYYEKDEYREAKRYFEQSLELSKSVEDKWNIANTLNNLAEVYLHLGNYTKTHKLLDESKQVSGISNSLEIMKESHDIRMKTFAAQGRYKEAFDLFEPFIAVKDSLINTEKSQNIAELEAKYESEKRDRQNELLKTEMKANEAIIERQKIIFIGSMILIIVLLVYSFTLLRYNRLRKKAGVLLRKQKDEIEVQNITLENLNSELSYQNKEINKQKTELENLIKVKDKLFSILSHDIRSPLNSFAGILHLMKNGLIDKKEEKIYLSELDTKIGYTQHFIENMLQWSRSQLDGFTISIEKFDIKDLVIEVLNNFDLQAGEKGIKLLNEADQAINVDADRNLIRIALGNLISNAIKFTSSGGGVIIKTELTGKKCRISVQDTGLGMDRETIEKISSGEKIKTLPGTAEELGSGLGLYIAKDFVEKNKGMLFIESQKGVGSTFSFTVPVAD